VNLIFDFGGVVFTWRPVDLLMQAWPQRCPDAARARDMVRAFFQGSEGDWARFDLGRIDAEELARRTEQRLGIAQGEVLHLLHCVHDHLSPRADTVHWLERLAAEGHRLYYLSNMPPTMADELERRHAFLGLFRAGVFSGREHLAKPDPAVFELALARFGLQAGEAVFFDDHPPNIEQARRLGLHAVLFSDAQQAATELAGLAPAR
jgi:epoxide hydrolase-like predicted phosphatase